MRFLSMLITISLLSGNLAAKENFYISVNLGVSMIDDSAHADPIQTTDPGTLPAEISINGLSFDSNETTWGALVGWRATDWLALELGYADLGNVGDDFLTGFAAFGGSGVVITNAVALNIDEWYFGTKFRLPLSSKFSANWFAGISRAEFEAQGQLVFFRVLPGGPPFAFEPVVTKFASPDQETGLIWGFGFAWKVNKRLSLDLGYRQHNTQVINVDTISLGFLISM